MVSEKAKKKVLAAFEAFYPDENFENAEDTEFLEWLKKQPDSEELREAFFILVFGDKG
jgi:hypothetical protein